LRNRETLIRYEVAVSSELLKEYALTWADACGDQEVLERAFDDQLTVREFVNWFAQKYGLTPRRSDGLSP